MTDCAHALNLFHNKEVTVHGNQDFEYLAPEASPAYLRATQSTPRRYEYSKCKLHTVSRSQCEVQETAETCVVAIIMVAEFWPENFPPGAGPDRPGHNWQPTDVSNFRDMWFGGTRLLADCWRKKGSPGWIEVGAHRDIGLFMWATNSEVDQRFLWPRLGLPHHVSIEIA